MIRVLITGANGQLGSELKKNQNKINANFIFTDIDELDLTDEKALFDFFNSTKIDYLINCAAYTAVDKAESDHDLAKLLNVIVPQKLAKYSIDFNFKLIHISTDFVFDGNSSSPYTEDNKPNPQSIYGKTKLDGENEILSINEESIIVRTSWLYSNFGSNFVKIISKLARDRDKLNIIFDQIGTPTYANDLSLAIIEIIKSEFVHGIYHYSNEGVTSWYDFALKIIELQNIKCELNPIETKSYPTPAKRPYYSLMNKGKIKDTFKINIRHWEEALKEALQKK